ncbi:hypothetical protein GP486_002193 [Trichoglossum hirsutum]|uniref:Uncharacterized protein n=1 Tax=Trichoglossum hirsutum TaxID=265104 RepID=A0A9P8LFI6_9PEZI|nr:hypothetical protein GP486_002193 [Trichoglossum hirsutum]
MSTFISLVEANLIKVSYDSLTDNTASVTISGSGPYKPEGVPGFKTPISIVQDASNPLKFYTTYQQESFAPPEGDVWNLTETFEAPLGEGDHGTINIIVAIYGSEVGGELDLTFSLFPGLSSATGDASGDPL